MADYAPQRALANRLIEAKGVLLTFTSLGGTPLDPDKPWLGNTGPTTGTFRCVRVEPSSTQRLGLGTIKEDLLGRSQHVLIVAPGDGSAKPTDFEKVTVAGEVNGIIFVEALDPDTSGGIVYFVGAGR
jgi:hypothetical protein